MSNCVSSSGSTRNGAGAGMVSPSPPTSASVTTGLAPKEPGVQGAACEHAVDGDSRLVVHVPIRAGSWDRWPPDRRSPTESAASPQSAPELFDARCSVHAQAGHHAVRRRCDRKTDSPPRQANPGCRSGSGNAWSPSPRRPIPSRRSHPSSATARCRCRENLQRVRRIPSQRVLILGHLRAHAGGRVRCVAPNAAHGQAALPQVVCAGQHKCVLLRWEPRPAQGLIAVGDRGRALEGAGFKRRGVPLPRKGDCRIAARPAARAH